MQGYCEKVNTFVNDKFYFCISDGNLQFYRDSTKSKLVDSVVLNNKTTIQESDDRTLKLTNIFLQSGGSAPKFSVKFDDQQIRNEWRKAIEEACRPTAAAAAAPRTKPPAATKSHNASLTSTKAAEGHIESLSTMDERIEAHEMQNKKLSAELHQLRGQLSAICQNGGKELPGNKAKIARLMKEIKRRTDSMNANDGMMDKLRGASHVEKTLLSQTETVAVLKSHALNKGQIAQLRDEADEVIADAEEQEEDIAEMNSRWASPLDYDDDALESELAYLGPVSAAEDPAPLPSIQLPAAGSKKVPSGARGGAASASDSDDELERIRCAM